MTRYKNLCHSFKTDEFSVVDEINRLDELGSKMKLQNISNNEPGIKPPCQP